MSGLSTLKVQEGERTANGLTLFALAISLVIESKQSILEDIRHVNEAVIKWARKRARQCEMLTIVYETDPANQEVVLQYTRSMLEQDVPEVAAIREREINILFHQAGKIYKQLRISGPEGATL